MLTGPLMAANTTGVFSPEVKAGSKAFEYRFSGTEEDGDTGWAQRFHYQQALNDAWRWRLIAAFSDPDGGDFEYKYGRLEVLWQFFEDEDAGWDSALRFEYQLADGDDEPSRARIAWAGKWNFDSGMELRANVLTGRQFGPDASDGWLLGLRSQMTWPVTSRIRLGVETFSDLNDSRNFGSWSDQEHQIGPVLKAKIGDDWKLLASWLVGANDATDDHDFRLHLIRSF